MPTITTFVSDPKHPFAMAFLAFYLAACGGGSVMGANSTLGISDEMVSEDTGNMIFTVTRSGSISGTVTVDYATMDGTAVAGSDYAATSGTLTFAPGEMAHTIAVPIIDDAVPELTEKLFLTLSNATHATIAVPSAGGTIMDNDTPILSVSDVIASEGAGTMIFTVTSSGAISRTVTVDYATMNGTALAGSDYTATSGTLTFNPGEITHTIAVPIIDDAVVEPSERLFLTLSNATTATIAVPSAGGTILDNDALASLAITDVAVSEAAGSMVFTVLRSGPTTSTVTVDYATMNGTALAGSDYTATSGTLTFNPGVATQTIAVPIIDDTVIEPSETLLLNLSNATNATIGRSSGTGTIVDND